MPSSWAWSRLSSIRIWISAFKRKPAFNGVNRGPEGGRHSARGRKSKCCGSPRPSRWSCRAALVARRPHQITGGGRKRDGRKRVN
jgi:hypothetical protein